MHCFEKCSWCDAQCTLINIHDSHCCAKHINNKTMEECRQIIARAWCTPENAHKTMDIDLANAFASILYKELNDIKHKN